MHDGGGPLVAVHNSSGVHKKQQKRREQGAWQLAGSMMEFPLHAAQQSAAASHAAESQQPDLPPQIDPDDLYRLVIHSPLPAKRSLENTGWISTMLLMTPSIVGIAFATMHPHQLAKLL